MLSGVTCSQSCSVLLHFAVPLLLALRARLGAGGGVATSSRWWSSVLLRGLTFGTHGCSRKIIQVIQTLSDLHLSGPTMGAGSS